MKILKLNYLLLALLLVIIACKDDKAEVDTIAPVVQITSPNEGVLLENGQFSLQATISDNIALKETNITVNNKADNMLLFEKTIAHTGKEASINEAIRLDVLEGGDFQLKLNTIDQSGNASSSSLNFQIANTNMGTLDLNFRLLYGGEPLITFDEITYPNPEIPFHVSLFSAFISNVTISNGTENMEIMEIQRLRINEEQSDMETALEGGTLSIPTVSSGNYVSIKFNIGVPEDLNAKSPVDYPQNHPLFFSGEYWDSWDSYIFFKVEGKADTDMDGTKETGIALHGGSNDALRVKEFTMDFEIKAQETTTLHFTVDIKDFFERDGAIYDLINTPQIHSLDQIPQTNELADNLLEAIQ